MSTPRSLSPARDHRDRDRDPHVIDRQTTTPFLLNFCYRSSAFHNLTDFPVPLYSSPASSATGGPRRAAALPSHLQIYTWYSCTLKELAYLLTSTLPHIMPDSAVGTRLSFRLVYPDTSASAAGKGGRLGGEEGRGRYVSKEMGSVVVSASLPYSDGRDDEGKSGFELGGDDAEKTLADARFVIGDFIDCAVFPPLSDGSVVPRNNVGGAGSRTGFRENGFGRPRGSGYATNARGGYSSSRGDFGAGSIPSGEWRRGERLPDASYRGGTYNGRGGRRAAPY